MNNLNYKIFNILDEAKNYFRRNNLDSENIEKAQFQLVTSEPPKVTAFEIPEGREQVHGAWHLFRFLLCID